MALKDGADALAFALYREILASLLMLALVYYRGRVVNVERRDAIRVFFLGFCSFINVVGTILALQYISAVRYSVMQPIIPVIATLISVGIRLEHLTPIKSVGILCAVGGAILVETWHSGDSDDDDSSNVVLGTVLVCIQVTGMASLIVFQKPLLNRYDPTVLTFVYYSIGSVITVVMAICWTTRFTSSDFYFNGHLTPWIALAYATTFATFYAYNAYSWAGKRVSPAVTTVYNTVQPVGTSVLSFLFMGTVVTLPEILGGLLVMIGLVITVYGRQKELDDESAGRLVSTAAEYTEVSQDNGSEPWLLARHESDARLIQADTHSTRTPLLEE
eukprot:CAMPEP_0185031090 /NCGR_PEP_ID=MMETSP1103-20130426/18360_1 /TAXON_ID=36769 /ORGANISM="Paraphysomonas bandaiensis, Strain Caron Lab Isolate" /LENGTH=330 /DNA_ID=CAMNT_0027566477 /DNA_START=260 /DNA_END=1252 /DNA_ORIENTATION=-